MNGYHLAQINIARFAKPKDDPANADFMNGLDPVNAQAEAAPGFVWRLVGEGNDAVDLSPDETDPRLAINMSLWTDVEALGAFVYRNPDHLAFMRRRREWMEHMKVYQALWWVPAGHIPTLEEGLARIAQLEEHGPTAEAFTFRQPFPAPDGTPAVPVLDECA
ncbi:DUF3291 domain-containing protein [Alterisphingorhabdus coralli]|uniref:DUF3291 domain-containing protein n=1 Tax=Alterisphingorhabdus coralli TaxID=3071408 RepID=A0AA97I0A6_9SPHN|nr:DUF3291 domain-containing protein [Parasphingorhabdus sp. SCSIO 66989]WOE74702.1 DUF3291 domain-containing protein [Parasphingorhabdus sp. SCSIO 66989]